jgi:hypothetical protein
VSTSPVSADGPAAKLAWATRHLDMLTAELAEVTQTLSHRLQLEVDYARSGYAVTVQDLPPVPGHWALLLGDCVHNARSALDHLAVQLVAQESHDDPASIGGSTQFPMTDDARQFRRRTQGMRSDVVERLQQLQLARAYDPRVWGSAPQGLMRPVGETLRIPHEIPIGLYLVTELDNVDKHRVIHAAWYACAWHRGTDLALPAEVRLTNQSYQGRPLAEGMEIGFIGVEPHPVPFGVSQEELRAKYPLQVVLSEDATKIGADTWFDVVEVTELLKFCLWSVTVVLDVFAPTLRDGSTPISLTAAKK